MDWEEFRRRDGSINLYAAWLHGHNGHEPDEQVEELFTRIEGLRRINSRQLAAVLLVVAEGIPK